MAYTSGVKGLVVMPALATGSAAATGFIRRWDAEIAGELFDATTWENQTNHPESIRGLHDLKGSCEAIFDGANKFDITALQIESAPAIAGFELYMMGSTHGYTFSGLVGILDLTVERRGQAIVVISFESTGAIVTV